MGDDLKQQIKDWTTCPVIGAPKQVNQRPPKCHPPARESCKAGAVPPIVNAVDGGEAMKCAHPVPFEKTGGDPRKALNVLGQPLCDNPWQSKKTDDEMGIIVNTIGQRQLVISREQQEIDSAQYNTIGQKLVDECWKGREDKCPKVTLNILGQAIRECEPTPKPKENKSPCHQKHNQEPSPGKSCGANIVAM